MSTRAALFALAGVAILAALFIAFRPAPHATATLPAAAAAVAPPSPVAPAPMVAELVVKDAALISGPTRIQVRQGDSVVLRVTSDRADELHLHGYDLEAQLQPEVAANLGFVADRSGRFELELHHAHLELAALEVAPAP